VRPAANMRPVARYQFFNTPEEQRRTINARLTTRLGLENDVVERHFCYCRFLKNLGEWPILDLADTESS